MSLFQSNLRKQIRNLPKILNFVKIIHYYSKLFTSLLRRRTRRLLPAPRLLPAGGAAARRAHDVPRHVEGERGADPPRGLPALGGRHARLRRVHWAANKRFKVLKFKFKFPRARTFELLRARSRLYRSQILQVNTRWKALAEIYTMHSFAPFSNLNFFVKNRQFFLRLN